jgi:hypothetical protein
MREFPLTLRVSHVMSDPENFASLGVELRGRFR